MYDIWVVQTVVAIDRSETVQKLFNWKRVPCIGEEIYLDDDEIYEVECVRASIDEETDREEYWVVFISDEECDEVFDDVYNFPVNGWDIIDEEEEEINAKRSL